MAVRSSNDAFMLYGWASICSDRLKSVDHFAANAVAASLALISMVIFRERAFSDLPVAAGLVAADDEGFWRFNADFARASGAAEVFGAGADLGALTAADADGKAAWMLVGVDAVVALSFTELAASLVFFGAGAVAFLGLTDAAFFLTADFDARAGGVDFAARAAGFLAFGLALPVALPLAGVFVFGAINFLRGKKQDHRMKCLERLGAKMA